jgi:hypothetical protein
MNGTFGITVKQLQPKLFSFRRTFGDEAWSQHPPGRYLSIHGFRFVELLLLPEYLASLVRAQHTHSTIPL